MQIAIIGAGNVGTSLAKGWSHAGHRIYIGSRDCSRMQAKWEGCDNISIHPIGEAIAFAGVIVLSVPPEAVLSVTEFLKDAGDKVIIDPTNSFRSRPEGYANAFEALMDQADCQNLVKAFNTTGFENMANPEGLDLFMSGDSMTAKSVVRQLAADLGFANCFDFGGKEQVALQEQLGMAWINLALMQGMGTGIGLNIVHLEQP